ncbi:hypothetical protein XELAEV_18009382mg [Xenopus laevis]|uniref:Uncharacterized protein n=1 Tax=Xenopus laevis TaxID=8355 RepID=A0A974I0I2_XENLA|nr:hypothetical protein XELAEV_18009382mg [Xenopus laevis]
MEHWPHSLRAVEPMIWVPRPKCGRNSRVTTAVALRGTAHAPKESHTNVLMRYVTKLRVAAKRSSRLVRHLGEGAPLQDLILTGFLSMAVESIHSS